MSVTFYRSSPEDVREEKISIPRDNDLPWTLHIKIFDEDCPECPAADLEPYDLNGHNIRLQVFENQFVTSTATPLVELTNAGFTLEQSAEAALQSKYDKAYRVLLWSDFIDDLTIGVEYWYRIFITDAADLDFTPVRGPFELEIK